MFSVPFDEIGAILDRSPDAARQLASRGRRRIRGADTTPDADAAAQQEVVEAFLAAARDGDFEALIAVLDPDIVLREDNGSGTIVEVRGAENVARRAKAASQLGLVVRHALINGAAGWVSLLDGQVYAIGALAQHDGRITTMDILLDPARLARLDLTALDLRPDGTRRRRPDQHLEARTSDKDMPDQPTNLTAQPIDEAEIASHVRRTYAWCAPAGPAPRRHPSVTFSRRDGSSM